MAALRPGLLADPSVPEAWWPAIRESLPAYDARTTPTRTMGLVDYAADWFGRHRD